MQVQGNKSHQLTEKVELNGSPLTSIEQLPAEVLNMIFGLLGVSDLTRLVATNKKYRVIILSDKVLCGKLYFKKAMKITVDKLIPFVNSTSILEIDGPASTFTGKNHNEKIYKILVNKGDFDPNSLSFLGKIYKIYFYFIEKRCEEKLPFSIKESNHTKEPGIYLVQKIKEERTERPHEITYIQEHMGVKIYYNDIKRIPIEDQKLAKEISEEVDKKLVELKKGSIQPKLETNCFVS